MYIYGNAYIQYIYIHTICIYIYVLYIYIVYTLYICILDTCVYYMPMEFGSRGSRLAHVAAAPRRAELADAGAPGPAFYIFFVYIYV